MCRVSSAVAVMNEPSFTRNTMCVTAQADSLSCRTWQSTPGLPNLLAAHRTHQIKYSFGVAHAVECEPIRWLVRCGSRMIDVHRFRADKVTSVIDIVNCMCSGIFSRRPDVLLNDRMELRENYWNFCNIVVVNDMCAADGHHSWRRHFGRSCGPFVQSVSMWMYVYGSLPWNSIIIVVIPC